MEVALIDKIIVPVSIKEKFIERMNANIRILKKQTGFIKHDTYEQQGENDDLIFVTVVGWKNAEAFTNAKAAVEEEYQRSGFNLKEFCLENNIRFERNGVFQSVDN